MIAIASRNAPVMESEQYYTEALEYEQVLERHRASAALGFDAQLDVQGAEVSWRVVDTNKQPVTGLKGHIELRVPWALLWVADPSQRRVVADDPGTPDIDTKVTEGVAVLAAWVKREGAEMTLVEGLPRVGAGSAAWRADSRWAWPTWHAPKVKQRHKPQVEMWREVWRAPPEKKL